MSALEKNRFVLSLAILALATLAIFAPALVFGATGGILFIALVFHSPTFGILAAILASVFGEFGRIEVAGISFLILDLVAPAVFGIWLLRKFTRKEKIILDGVSSSLLVFWAIGFLSLIFASEELAGEELKFAFLHFLRFVGISGMLLVARDCGRKEAAGILNSLLFAGFLLAISGFILLRVFPDFAAAGLTEAGWDPHVGRLASTFFDPNFTGGVFAFLLAILGGKFLREQKFAKQVFLIAIAGILGIALFLTFSRSALLALGFSGLILGIFGSRKILLAMLAVGILGMSISPRLAERVGEFTQSMESISGESQQILDPTAQLRVDSWQEGWRIWRENPFLGVGFGAYKFQQTFSSEDSHAATGSDASLLNVGATTGFLGFGIFGILLWNLAAASFRKKEWGFLAALGGILVHSIFVNSLFFPPLALYFFVSAGLAVSEK
ncbi:MAG: O-antigen ligase family protein [Patescibacteria group bacterium]